jgi:phage gp29-like protein
MWDQLMQTAEAIIGGAAARALADRAGIGERNDPRQGPLPAQPGERPPQSMSFPQFDRWSHSPGRRRRLLLRHIFAAYDEADQGDPLEMCDLFEARNEVDGHTQSQFASRREDVARKPWEFLPGGDGDNDKLAARLLDETIRDVPGWVTTLEHQLSFVGYGWAGTEIEWRRIGGLVQPVWFRNVAHRRFRFDDHDQPLLHVDGGDPHGEPLRAGAWWFTSGPGRTITASGLWRTAAILSWIKSAAFRDWIVWSNRYGLPFVHGTYTDGPDEAVNEQEKAILRRAVKSLGTDGWAIFSKACEIVITETSKGGKADDVQGALAAFCNNEISKLITGATQNVEMGTSGSYAQAEIHAQRAFGRVYGDYQKIAETVRTAIAKPFVQWNNLNARPPVLVIRIVRDEAPLSRAKVFAIARNEIGVDLDADQVRHELQLRAPTGEVLKAPAVPAPVEDKE